MAATKKFSIFLALLAGLCAGNASGQDAPKNVEARKELDANVVAAWKTAGALVGWLSQSEFGEWRYLRAQPKGVASLPVFLWQKFDPGVLAKLPAPSAPFAIGLGGTAMNNAGLKELAKFQNLQSLDLSHTQVTDVGLKQLAALKNLRSLDLGASAVTDAGLKELAKIKSLRKLYFGSTAVTDAGVEKLTGIKDLHTLYLYNTAVTDATLKALAGLKKLESLLLVKTKVTDQGVAELTKGRPKLRIMR